MKKSKMTKLILIIILLMLTGCSGNWQNMIEKKEITRKAREYLAEKYGIKRFDYKIVKNKFYGEHETCFLACSGNSMKIKYNDKIYLVEYDLDNDIFSDDIQYNTILQAFSDKFVEMYAKPNDIYVNLEKQNTEYFDGTNLENVARNIHMYAYYYDENYNDNDEFIQNFHDIYGGCINLLYFKNLSDYNKFKLDGTTHQGWNTFDSHWNYAKHVNFYISINAEGKIVKSANKKIDLGHDLILNAWDLSLETKIEQISSFDLDNVDGYDKTKYITSSNFYNLVSDEVMKTPRILINKDMCVNEDCLMVIRRIITNGETVYSVLNLSNDDEQLYFMMNFHSNNFDFVILKRKT